MNPIQILNPSLQVMSSLWAIQPEIFTHSDIAHACYIKCVPYHQSMKPPHVADREEGLQIWSVAVNMLNKVTDSQQGVVLQLGMLLTTPHHKDT
jgi:hypothetical protein